MQTISLSGSGTEGPLLDSKISTRLRAFRFVSDRYARRDRPNVAAEFILFAVIVAVAIIWPMVTLVHAFSVHR